MTEKAKKVISMDDLNQALEMVRDGLVEKPRKSGTPEYVRSPVMRFVNLLPEGQYFTTQQAASELGCSASMLRKISREPSLTAPSTCVVSGNFKAYLYTPDDIEELRGFLAKRNMRVQPNIKSEPQEESA